MRKLRVVTAMGVGILLACSLGCVRRDGRNSDCVWPGEAGAMKLDASQPAAARHLSRDLEFAEELADRYTNVHYGPHSGYSGPPIAGKMRATCLNQMADAIGKEHGVSHESLVAVFGKNRGWIDAAEIVPFALLFGLVAMFIARKIWRRFPPEEGWAPGIVSLTLCAAGAGLAAMLIGQVWMQLMENFRIGTGHLGPRVDRLFMVRHAAWVFACGVVAFLAVAGVLAPRSGTGRE